MNTTHLRGQTSSRLVALLVNLYLVDFLIIDLLDTYILAILAIWGVSVCLQPSYRGPIDRAHWFFFLPFILFYVSAEISMWANGTTLPGQQLSLRYARFLLVIPLFVLFRRYYTWRSFTLAVVIAGMVLGIWAILHMTGLAYDTGVDRRKAMVNNVQLGSLSMLIAFLSAASLPTMGSIGRGYLISGTAGCCGAILAAAVSEVRIPWLAMPVYLILLLWHWYGSGWLNLKNLVPIPVLLILITTILLSVTDIAEDVNEGIAEARNFSYASADTDDSVGIRLVMWHAAWHIGLENIWLGAGPGDYLRGARQLMVHDQSINPNVLYSRTPHNEYLSVFCTRGLFGLSGLVLVFLVPMITFGKNLSCTVQPVSSIAVSGTGLILGYMIYSLTESIFNLTSFLNTWVILMGILGGLLYQQLDARRD